MQLVGGSTTLFVSGSGFGFQSGFRGFTGNGFGSITLPAGTSLTGGAEIIGMNVDLSATQVQGTGNYALSRDWAFKPSKREFSGAVSVTDAVGHWIQGAPIAGTNATFTNAYSLFLGGNAVNGGGTVTNSYGLYTKPNTGATTNWGSFSEGKQGYEATNTASGTTGAQTINKPSGTVNFAAGANSLVVTNSLCTVDSIIFAVVRTNDTTAIIKNVTPAAGSFTIRLNANATAETSVGFFIIN